MNTSCDIYAEHIRALRDKGDIEALAEMVETWYTRCGFDGGRAAICGAGVYPSGNIWIQTTEGKVEYCFKRDRWRLVEHDAAGECKYLFSMFRIAEITQAPWGYLCGLRDAMALVERQKCAEASKQLKEATASLHSVESKLKKAEARLKATEAKAMRANAMCSVANIALTIQPSESQRRVLEREYPEAPKSVMSWNDIRLAYRGTPGVYFVWSGDRIVYVGATTKGMYERLAAKHDNATKADRFSFLEMPRAEVYFAEAVYIARHAPERNAIVASVLKANRKDRRGKREEAPAVQVG